MLIVIVIICVLIFFPLFLNINIFYNNKEKKLFYKLYLFKFIVLIKGYAEKIEEGFAFHISKKKAFIIEYKSLLGLNKKIKPLKDYHIIKFYSEIDYGNVENNINSVFIAKYYEIINNLFCKVLVNNKPYIKINNNFNVYLDSNVFNIKCKITIILNLFMIILSLIKIFVGKIFYAFKFRKQQN